MTGHWWTARPVRGCAILTVLIASVWTGGLAARMEPAAQLLESARVSMPAFVEFQVTDVALSTDASTGPSTVSFDQALLLLGRAVRISVKAESDMVAPDGPPIPASNVSWRTSSVSNGVGVDGVLSTTAYAEVYQGNVGATSGSLAVTWTLAAPGSGVRAGTHSATLRWKVESIFP